MITDPNNLLIMGTPNKSGGLGKFFKAAIEVKAITSKASSR